MKHIKLITLFIIVLILSISAGINISRQLSSLLTAKSEVIVIQKKVEDLKSINKKLVKKIEYASSSAYLDQQARDKFGMGTEDDVWLVLDQETKTDLFPYINKVDSRSNFQKWFDLFTK